MSLDLSMIKSVDVHTHPFVPNESPYTPAEFLEQLSLAVVPGMFDQKITRGATTIYSGLNMYMHITIQRLATYYSCEANIEAVVEKRNEYAKNFSTYTKRLFQD